METTDFADFTDYYFLCRPFGATVALRHYRVLPPPSVILSPPRGYGSRTPDYDGYFVFICLGCRSYSIRGKMMTFLVSQLNDSLCRRYMFLFSGK